MKNKFLAFSVLVIGLTMLVTACAKKEKISEFGNPYVHHVSNDGPKPMAGEYVFFHYEVFLDDSLVEDSRKRGVDPNAYKMPDLEPMKAQEDAPISPVIDGISMMAEGDSLTISKAVADLPMVPSGFEKYQMVHYVVKLIDIMSEEDYQAVMAEKEAAMAEQRAVVQAREEGIAQKVQDILARYNNGQLTDSIQTTESGLKYVIHREGPGASPATGDNVQVHYYGVLTDGTMFDNSYRRGDLFTFGLGTGQVIKGWDEGIALLKEGGAGTFFIPAELGYGERGAPPTIPANSELVFYVELEKAK